MAHGIPDRAPVMCQLSWGHILLHSGVKPVDFLYTAKGFAEGVLRMRQRYQFDGVILNLYSIIDPALLAKSTVTNLPNGQTIEFPDGRTLFCPFDDDPRRVRWPEESPPRFEDTAPESLPDYQEFPEWRFETTRLVVAAIGQTCSVHGSVGSPFDRLVFHFGTEAALMALVEDPDKALACLLRFAEQQFYFAKAQIDLGSDAMSISSPFAGSGFISPDMYRRFVLPAEALLVRRIRAYAPQVPVYTHTCGHIADRLELMAATGIQGIECMDPPPLGNTTLADAKARIGDQLFLKGNLDSVNVLLHCTPERLEDYVRETLAAGNPGGGFILSSACSVAPHVPPWVLEQLVPLAEKYARP